MRKCDGLGGSIFPGAFGVFTSIDLDQRQHSLLRPMGTASELDLESHAGPLLALWTARDGLPNGSSPELSAAMILGLFDRPRCSTNQP
jgi:hypothetical protein